MADQEQERWTKLVADFEAGDLTQREFASERGISFSNLRNWIYRLRKEARPLVEEAPMYARPHLAIGGPAFAADRPLEPRFGQHGCGVTLYRLPQLLNRQWLD